MKDFVHLHLHTEYSLLDGACRIVDLPERIKECGQNAVAITDHGVMYGVIDFYRTCKKAGIKPIIGCEVYVAPDSRFTKLNAGEGYAEHLVLLCENAQGYRNLVELVSRSFTEGFYNRPRVDDELLRQYSGGLIALSACLGGRIPKLLSKGDFAAAKENALRYANIFGKDRYYIEIQDHGLAEERAVLPRLVKLANECNLPLVATNDCHYLRRQDADTQAVLMCVQTNTTVDAGRPAAFATNDFYVKDSTEMSLLFRAYPEAIENTVKIADMCSVDFDFDTQYLPKFPCPNALTAEEYLRQLTEKGFQNRIARGHIVFGEHTEEEYRERLSYELGVISEMGFADYFLIVQDYVNYAKSKDIPVGPGRGSGAGSLVAYALGITDVDSIRFDLLFERFLNPERVTMPDIDVDFCYNRRDEVIEYVTRKYGADHVSQIITFGTMAARASIRDVGRALGMSYADVDVVARAIPQELNMTIDHALSLPELKKLYEGSEQVRRLVDTARSLEGMPRNVSVHAAGVVITDQPISNYLPVALSNGTVVTQFDMDTVASLGLLKFDFLALRYLTILHDAEGMIRESEPNFDIEKLPLDDAQTYALISSGKTSGIFQLESGGMRQMLTNLRPESLDDVIAAIALYRPGPMDSIPTFIECRHNPDKVTYVTPALEPILRSTYGCVVYQEQVMSIFREIGGYTFGHADIVRRAMSKKKADVLLSERECFVAGAKARGVDAAVAEQLFSDMESFANYAFNKSHAAAYAIISYRTAYLKCHYPQQYMAALLTSVLGSQTKVAEYISECNSRGIRVLPPDINESRMTFSTSGKDIRFGLLALKNVGVHFLEHILAERRHGKFTSFDDFINRLSATELNRRMVEALIKGGAFDCLGKYRSQLLAVHDAMIERALQKGKDNLEGQLDMFSMPGQVSTEAPAVKYPDIPELSVREKLMLEKEAAGMYFSGSLLDEYSRHIETMQFEPISMVVGEDADPVDRAAMKTVGIITSVTVKGTKNGKRMAFFTLEDRTAEMECIVFPNIFDELSPLLVRDNAVLVRGTISLREEEDAKLLVQTVDELVENNKFDPATVNPIAPVQKTPTYAQKAPEREQKVAASAPNIKDAKRLFLRVPDDCGELFSKVRNLVEILEGDFPAFFYYANEKRYETTPIGVSLTPYLLEQLYTLLGRENVILK